MENVVIRDSDEWDSIEFSLQLRCRSSRVRLLQAWNVIRPESLSMFNRRSKNMLVLEAFVDTESLDRSNSVQDVCTRGFDIGAPGFLVTFGNLSLSGFPLLSTDSKGKTLLDNDTCALDPNGNPLPSKAPSDFTSSIYGEKRVFDYFVCDVGVGKSLEVPDVVEAQRSRVSMPVEYDSYFLTNSENLRLDSLTVFAGSNETENGSVELSSEAQSKGVLPQNTFKHNYIIYDSSQILPRYLIQFEFDPSADESFALPLCDNCQSDVSTIYCPSDSARICSKCDVRLHSNNKVVSRHIRVPLSEMPRPYSKCRIHQTKSYHLYCTVCETPICQLCTVNHIHELEGSTSFIPISTAYEAVVQNLTSTTDFSLRERKNQLLDILKKVDEVKTQVSTNCQNVEAQCYEKLESALSDLNRMVEYSLEVVSTEQTENKRQLNEINWSECFVDYMRSTLLPADYLRSWLRHCRLRDEFALNSSQQPLKELFPDISLEAELSIIPKDTQTHFQTKIHT
ncbi:B-box zinc finger family protein [Theileria parva strain Muguga]|uniref:B-box zinc finger family protein n=1 Tax=Theileria parva strain Muguga TaxID=333668 RepID=UPI001C617E1E|nr:B-box zinc finger family protein [Theileria parva strain Muguga]EAN31624.2 B-box zinc finger family protein [Theileria parva strain Muguga]